MPDTPAFSFQNVDWDADPEQTDSQKKEEEKQPSDTTAAEEERFEPLDSDCPFCGVKLTCKLSDIDDRHITVSCEQCNYSETVLYDENEMTATWRAPGMDVLAQFLEQNKTCSFCDNDLEPVDVPDNAYQDFKCSNPECTYTREIFSFTMTESFIASDDEINNVKRTVASFLDERGIEHHIEITDEEEDSGDTDENPAVSSKEKINVFTDDYLQLYADHILTESDIANAAFCPKCGHERMIQLEIVEETCMCGECSFSAKAGERLGVVLWGADYKCCDKHDEPVAMMTVNGSGQRFCPQCMLADAQPEEEQTSEMEELDDSSGEEVDALAATIFKADAVDVPSASAENAEDDGADKLVEEDEEFADTENQEPDAEGDWFLDDGILPDDYEEVTTPVVDSSGTVPDEGEEAEFAADCEEDAVGDSPEIIPDSEREEKEESSEEDDSSHHSDTLPDPEPEPIDDEIEDPAEPAPQAEDPQSAPEPVRHPDTIIEPEAEVHEESGSDDGEEVEEIPPSHVETVHDFDEEQPEAAPPPLAIVTEPEPEAEDSVLPQELQPDPDEEPEPDNPEEEEESSDGNGSEPPDDGDKKPSVMKQHPVFFWAVAACLVIFFIGLFIAFYTFDRKLDESASSVKSAENKVDQKMIELDKKNQAYLLELISKCEQMPGCKKVLEAAVKKHMPPAPDVQKKYVDAQDLALRKEFEAFKQDIEARLKSMTGNIEQVYTEKPPGFLQEGESAQLVSSAQDPKVQKPEVPESVLRSGTWEPDKVVIPSDKKGSSTSVAADPSPQRTPPKRTRRSRKFRKTESHSVTLSGDQNSFVRDGVKYTHSCKGIGKLCDSVKVEVTHSN